MDKKVWVFRGWAEDNFTIIAGGYKFTLRNNRKHKGMYTRVKAMYDLLATRDGETITLTLSEYQTLRDGK